MANPKHGNAALVADPATITSPGFTPTTQQLADVVVDQAGGVGVVGQTTPGGAATLLPLLTQTQFSQQYVAVTGTLTGSATPAASPRATLAINTTRLGTATVAPGAYVDILFTFATTEAPSFGAPTAGTILGGASNGLIESGIVRVQTDNAGNFGCVITLPAGAPRTVTPVAFRVMATTLAGNVLDVSATSFGA